MSTTEDTYKGPRHNTEYDRLQKQHRLLQNEMGNKLILAPIDHSKADLRILDSATGVGEWLISASKEVSPSATLLGTDLAPQHFAEDRPKNISLTTQSIFEEWPADYHESFDLVHQRFVLTTCNEEAAYDAIQKLFKCVEPGGWIQLHEGDSQTIQEGPNHTAFMRFRDFVSKTWGLQDYQMAPGPKLKKWLADVGAVDIIEEVQVLKAGAAAEDAEQGQLAIDVLLGLLDSLHLHSGGESLFMLFVNSCLCMNDLMLTFAIPGMPGFFFSEEDFRSLRHDMQSELREYGNTWHYHVAYGRKPIPQVSRVT